MLKQNWKGCFKKKNGKNKYPRPYNIGLGLKWCLHLRTLREKYSSIFGNRPNKGHF